VVLYQVWAFVAPGLYSHEKRLVLPLVVSSTLLFFMGVAFCYFFVFGQVFTFIQGFAPKSITAAPDIEAYLSFVLTMFLAFGLAFEVPIAVVVLARLGVVSIRSSRSFRGYFVVLAFIIAAIVTPPDVVSQLALAIPMCLLYELGIWAARLFIKHTQAPDAEAGDRAVLPGFLGGHYRYWPKSQRRAWSSSSYQKLLVCVFTGLLATGRGRRPGVTSISTGSLATLQAEARRYLARLERGHMRQQFADRCATGFAGTLGDHVARPDAGLRRRAVAQHAGDDHALRGLDAEGLASSGERSLGSTPIQPRTTWPSRRCSPSPAAPWTLGMAKPMPMLPPERE
jgi:hypothetical protein